MPPSGCLPVTVPLSARSLVGSLRSERWLAAWLIESAGERPEIIAVSKAELPGAEEVRNRLAAETGLDVLLFSSVTGQGLDEPACGTATMVSVVECGVVAAGGPVPTVRSCRISQTPSAATASPRATPREAWRP